MMKQLVFLACLVAIAFSRISYEGQKVLTCRIPEDRKDSFYTVIEDVNAMDVWARRADGTADIRVKNEAEMRILNDFFGDLSACQVIIDDLEANAREFDVIQANASLSAEWFDAYHTYDENAAWWSQFAFDHRDVAVITYTNNIGQTYEKRNLYSVVINRGNTNKPWQYHQCGIHAREWIAPATCQYVFNELMKKAREGNNDALHLLDTYNFYLVPQVNPDGYAYTWSNDRQWRKNRVVISGSTCRGVDNNRNYDDHFNGGGSSTNPCSDTYNGLKANSELETQITSNAMASIQKTGSIIFAIDWHSYSQLILRPYGWTSTPPPDAPKLKGIGDAGAAAIKAQSGQTYVSQPSIDLYVTTGTASDYFYGNVVTAANGAFKCAGYTIELRPTGQVPGFQLPPAQIIPTGQENYAALIAMTRYITTHGAIAK